MRRVDSLVDFSKIRKLILQGGEPMKSEHYTKVLYKVPDISQVELQYNTNCSIMPSDELLSFWRKAKKVKVNLSIDGIDEHFDYLRWPLRWDQVKENIHKYVALSKEIPELHVHWTYVVTPFNIYYYDRYRAWAKQEFEEGSVLHRLAFQNPNPVQGTINMFCVPPSLKEELITKYKDSIDVPYNAKSIVDLVYPFNEELYVKFLTYVNGEDAKRKLNFREVFPEVEHHFK
jgi:hypothetical protein